jgi:hypothetical protein
MNGSISAISTALPRSRAASVTCNDELTGRPVPLSIKTRISATRWSATKKKIVGGSIASNSSFSFVASLRMLCLLRRVLCTLDDWSVMTTTTRPRSASWLTIVPPSGFTSPRGPPRRPGCRVPLMPTRKSSSVASYGRATGAGARGAASTPSRQLTDGHGLDSGEHAS